MRRKKQTRRGRRLGKALVEAGVGEGAKAKRRSKARRKPGPQPGWRERQAVKLASGVAKLVREKTKQLQGEAIATVNTEVYKPGPKLRGVRRHNDAPVPATIAVGQGSAWSTAVAEMEIRRLRKALKQSEYHRANQSTVLERLLTEQDARVKELTVVGMEMAEWRGRFDTLLKSLAEKRRDGSDPYDLAFQVKPPSFQGASIDTQDYAPGERLKRDAAAFAFLNPRIHKITGKDRQKQIHEAKEASAQAAIDPPVRLR
jgi:hypothetical protein